MGNLNDVDDEFDTDAEQEAAFFIVRINGKNNPKYDYKFFLDAISVNTEAPWDKDWQNKIKVGDYLGFIVGEKGFETVHIVKVKSETVREPHWKKHGPYVPGNGTKHVKYRCGIILTNVHDLPKTYDWKIIKESVGLAPACDSWMPRGTQVVKKKHLLPFWE
jgi:hypothetical protein